MCHIKPLPSLQTLHTIPPAATREDVNRRNTRVSTFINDAFLIASLHARDTGDDSDPISEGENGGLDITHLVSDSVINPKE